MTWLLAPPNPNDCTDALRSPDVGQGVASVAIFQSWILGKAIPFAGMLPTHLDPQLVCIDFWVQLLEVAVGGDDTGLKGQDRFDDSRNSTRTLEMTDIGFYGAPTKNMISIRCTSFSYFSYYTRLCIRKLLQFATNIEGKGLTRITVLLVSCTRQRQIR